MALPLVTRPNLGRCLDGSMQCKEEEDDEYGRTEIESFVKCRSGRLLLSLSWKQILCDMREIISEPANVEIL
jgi:hypothetical protein